MDHVRCQLHTYFFGDTQLPQPSLALPILINAVTYVFLKFQARIAKSKRKTKTLKLGLEKLLPTVVKINYVHRGSGRTV